MATLFSTPLPTHQQSQFAPRSRSRKRKREGPLSDHKEDDGSNASIGAQAHAVEPAVAEEYAAVISPQEREQRRLAHYPLTGPLLPSPFPHQPSKDDDQPMRKPYTRRQSLPGNGASTGQRSLRSQHLAAMSAVLHKSLQNKDYTRASRALGLILRTDINGKPIDIRSSGNWSIGAEILLRRDVQYRRQQSSRDGSTSSLGGQSLPFSRHGFERAKAMYENLIIQHPFRRDSPDSINAIDFYLAMFSLWIYVAQAEATELQGGLDMEQMSDSSVDYLSRLRDVKLAQLRQANEIADRLGKCTSSAPFSDNRDLLRMQAMLSLWQADLSDACQEFTQMDMDDENDASAADPETVASAVGNLQIQDNGTLSSKQLTQAALEARNLARHIFDRLGMDREDDD